MPYSCLASTFHISPLTVEPVWSLYVYFDIKVIFTQIYHWKIIVVLVVVSEIPLCQISPFKKKWGCHIFQDFSDEVSQYFDLTHFV